MHGHKELSWWCRRAAIRQHWYSGDTVHVMSVQRTQWSLDSCCFFSSPHFALAPASYRKDQAIRWRFRFRLSFCGWCRWPHCHLSFPCSVDLSQEFFQLWLEWMVLFPDSGSAGRRLCLHLFWKGRDQDEETSPRYVCTARHAVSLLQATWKVSIWNHNANLIELWNI